MVSTLGAVVDRFRPRNLVKPSPPPEPSSSSRPSYGLPNRGDRGAQLESMGAVSTLFAIVDALATGVAQTEWGLYRSPGPNAAADVPPTRVTNHAAWDLWEQPNPEMGRHLFVETGSQHYELVGESDWLVTRFNEGGLPLELWPVRPDKLRHEEDTRGTVARLAGWTYRNGPASVPLGVDDIIQYRRPNPLDRFRGIGPVQSLLADLESVQLSAEWNRRFFENDATPSGILSFPEELEDEEYRRNRDRWNDQHRGVSNAHRVAIIEGGAQWIDRSYTPRDMQFVALRNVSRDIIQEAYRFPKPLLGQTVSVRAEAEASEYIYSKWLLLSRLERIRGVLNTRLLPMFAPIDPLLYFDFDSPVAADEAAEAAAFNQRVAAAVALLNTGRFDPAAVLQVCGIPDIALLAQLAPSGSVG